MATTPLTRIVRVTSGTRSLITNSQGGSRTHAGLITDEPGAGSHTYRLQVAQASGSATSGLTAATLVVFVIKR